LDFCPGNRISTRGASRNGAIAEGLGFDVTPSRLVTGLITERGVLKPDRGALARAFPERLRTE
jgi:methylthioribose-1-phosphate isomerase